MNEVKSTSIIWIALISLTLLSAGASHIDFGEIGTGKLVFLFIALASLTVKGQLIVDHFMELKHVKFPWRLIMSAYCAVISIIVFLIYAIWA